ncbi:hypothetical protein CAPTEDRAFT_194141 [Capitella teleta]|uniref:Uncharacterized protein n=1 Tax=Capitella teleta TaxID=283909 RepID=R7TDQ5_CAPTE|nr:hypothetical protein CAPTEDRAFT_194141 [Capitella teleta]|eukprot:ELT91829.1 hypothetical protein CAPTEDRAFT_194141 [Capitella teleta]
MCRSPQPTLPFKDPSFNPHTKCASIEQFYYFPQHHLSNWDGFLTYPCSQMQGHCDYSELVAEDAREEENVYSEVCNTGEAVLSRPKVKVQAADENHDYLDGEAVLSRPKVKVQAADENHEYLDVSVCSFFKDTLRLNIKE